MEKTNWTHVFLGGLLAGIVLNILGFASIAMYARNLWKPEVEALNPAFQESIGFWTFWIVFYLVVGFLTIWLYSAIRPRYGAGPKTAVIAGLAIWALWGLSFVVISASFGLFSEKLLFTDALTTLVMMVVAALLGAWIYKEESP